MASRNVKLLRGDPGVYEQASIMSSGRGNSLRNSQGFPGDKSMMTRYESLPTIEDRHRATFMGKPSGFQARNDSAFNSVKQ